jgi:hypothetical protein
VLLSFQGGGSSTPDLRNVITKLPNSRPSRPVFVKAQEDSSTSSSKTSKPRPLLVALESGPVLSLKINPDPSRQPPGEITMTNLMQHLPVSLSVGGYPQVVVGEISDALRCLVVHGIVEVDVAGQIPKKKQQQLLQQLQQLQKFQQIQQQQQLQHQQENQHQELEERQWQLQRLRKQQELEELELLECRRRLQQQATAYPNPAMQHQMLPDLRQQIQSTSYSNTSYSTDRHSGTQHTTLFFSRAIIEIMFPK